MGTFGERTMLGLRQLSSSQANVAAGRQSLGPQRATAKDPRNSIARQSIAVLPPRSSLGRNLDMTRPSLGFGPASSRHFMGRNASAVLNKTMNHTTLNNRRSSIYGTERGPIKDNRPMGDRGFQKRCMAEILRFLTEANYPHAISEKILTSPMMKDFSRIFIFLYNKIDPNFRFNIGAKQQELMSEIQKALNTCLYPYQINKSAFSTWTPTTWPHLLGVLHFLVQRAKDLDAQGAGEGLWEMLGGEDNDVAEQQIIFEYTTSCYDEFMLGGDDYSHFDDILQPFVDRNQALLDTLKHNSEYLAEQQQVLEDMAQQNRLPEARERQAALQSDKTKYEKLITVRERSLAKHTKRVEELAKVQETKEAEKAELYTVISELKEKISTQAIDPSEVKLIKLETAAVRESIKNIQQERTALRNQLLDLQNEERGATDRLAAVVDSYNAATRSIAPVISKLDMQQWDIAIVIQMAPKLDTARFNFEMSRAGRELQKMVADVEKCDFQLKARIQEAQRALEMEDNDLRLLESMVAAWAQHVEELKSDIDTQIRDLQKSLNQDSHQVSQLQRRVNTLSTEICADQLAWDMACLQERHGKELQSRKQEIAATEDCIESLKECVALALAKLQNVVQRLTQQAQERVKEDGTFFTCQMTV